LRCGELMALEWTDVDLVKSQLCVERSQWKGHVTSPYSCAVKQTEGFGTEQVDRERSLSTGSAGAPKARRRPPRARDSDVGGTARGTRAEQCAEEAGTSCGRRM